MNIQSGLRSVFNEIHKHDVGIRIGLGIGAMLIATKEAIEVTPKAVSLLEEEKARKGEELTKVEKVKTVGKLYLPVLLLEALGIACIIDGNVRSSKQNAALMVAYGLSESALKEYQDKVVETLGEKKEKRIHDELAKDRLAANPIDQSKLKVIRDEPLCYDYLTNRPFKCTRAKLDKAINEFNYRLEREHFLSLNEFYYILDNEDLEPCGLGEELGWHINDGLIEPRYSTQFAADDTPCTVLDFYQRPTYYYKSRY